MARVILAAIIISALSACSVGVNWQPGLDKYVVNACDNYGGLRAVYYDVDYFDSLYTRKFDIHCMNGTRVNISVKDSRGVEDAPLPLVHTPLENQSDSFFQY